MNLLCIFFIKRFGGLNLVLYLCWALADKALKIIIYLLRLQKKLTVKKSLFNFAFKLIKNVD